MQTPSSRPGQGRALALRRTLGPNVIFLGVVSLLNDASSEMIFPLLPVFLTTVLGVNMAFLGLIEGAAESTTSLFKLGSGWFSDRFGRRKPLVLGGYSLAALCRPMIALSTAGWHVLALRLGDRAGKGMRSAPRDALISESVGRENFGLAFGFHRSMDHAGAVAGPLLAMGLIALLGGNLRLVFLLAALPGLASAVVMALAVRDVAAGRRSVDQERVQGDAYTGAASGTDAGPGVGAKAPGRGVPNAGLRPGAPDGLAGPGAPQVFKPHVSGADGLGARPGPRAGAGRALGGGTSSGGRNRIRVRGPFLTYLIAVALFSLANSTDAFLLLRLRDLGVSVALLPAVWALLHIVKALSTTPGGYLADRLGRKRVLLAGWFVYTLTYMGFAATSSPGAAVALFAFYGVYFGLAEGTEKALVAQLAPAARGTAYGLYHLAVGVTALPASVVFGLVWERWGPQAAFLLGAAFALAAALVLMAVRAEARHVELGGRAA